MYIGYRFFTVFLVSISVTDVFSSGSRLSTKHGNVIKSKPLMGTRSCQIPSAPNTIYFEKKSESEKENLKPNSVVDGNGAVVHIECGDGARESTSWQGEHYMVCYDGQWYPPNNVCIKLCPALSFPNSVFECTLNGEPVSCEGNIQPGTVATRTCKSGYRDETHDAPNNCKHNGEWEYKHVDCYTDCGVIDRDYQSNNTEYDDLLTFPWKAGLYMKKGDSNDFEFICGATLLETGNVITAASCVKNSNGSLISSDLLRVGLGKSYMPWNDPRDIHAQKFEVTRTSDGYLHALVIGNQFSKFKKSLELFEPLSFIFMKGAIDLSAFTRAICIDSIGSNSRIEFLEGEVFGWDRDGNHVSYNITLYTNEYCKTLIFNLRNRDAELEKEIMEFGRFCTDRALPDTLYGSSVMYYDEGEKVFNLVGVLISVHESISIFQGLRDREASEALLYYYNNLISLVDEKQ